MTYQRKTIKWFDYGTDNLPRLLLECQAENVRLALRVLKLERERMATPATITRLTGVVDAIDKSDDQAAVVVVGKMLGGIATVAVIIASDLLAAGDGEPTLDAAVMRMARKQWQRLLRAEMAKRSSGSTAPPA